MVVLLVAGGLSVAARAQSIPQSETTEVASKEGKPAKRVDPANAEKSLDAAANALDGGKAEQVIQQINSLMSGARLQGRSMGRALYLRGAAYHKQNKPAQAIADLTSALWLKGGLSDADRLAALALRSEAYRQAGLDDLAEADARKAGRTSGQTASAAPSQAPVGNAQSTRTSEPTSRSSAAQQPDSSGGVSGFFSNLFGGSPNAASVPTASANLPRDAGRPASSSRQPSVGDAWSTTVESKPAARARQPASVREETAAIPPKEEAVLKPANGAASSVAKPHGRYRLQVAAVRGQTEAQAVAARLKKDYAALLAGREPEVDATVIGNMGTFYRVRIGPFADAAESGTLCAKLRGIGLDCLIMTE